MTEKIAAYLTQPTAENYGELRSLLLGSPAFRPDSTQVHQLWELIEAGRLEEAEKLSHEVMASYLLSPLAHTAMAALAEKQGDADRVRFEQAFAIRSRQSLLDSGDGTPEKPFRVTRVDDIYSVLAAKRARLQSLTTRLAGGRILDEVVTDQGTMFFDVTAPFEAYHR